MSLSQRLASVQANAANRGCRTCKWVATLTDSDRKALTDWVSDGKSGMQLWEIATAEGLPISLTAFRNHLRTCRES